MKFLPIIRSFLFGLSLICVLPGNELSAGDERLDGGFGNHHSRKLADNPLQPKSVPAPSVGDKPLNGQSKEKGADNEQPAAADIDSSLPESFKRLGLRPFPSFPRSEKASKEQPVPADQASLPESFKHLGLSPFPSFPSRDDRDRKDKELLGHKNAEPRDAQLVLNEDKQWSDEELLAIYTDDIESGRLVITEEEMAGLRKSFIQKNQRKLTNSFDQFVFEKKILEAVRSGNYKSDYSELRSEIQRERASGRLPITAQEKHALTDSFLQQNVADFIRFVREQKPALIIREDESLLDAGLSDEKLWPIIVADLRSGRITEEEMAGLQESFLEQNKEKLVRLLISLVVKKKMLEAAGSGKPKKSESQLELEAQHAIQSGKIPMTRQEYMLFKASFFQKNQAEFARFIRAKKVAEAVYAATWRGKCALLIKTNYASLPSLPSPVKHIIDVSLGLGWVALEECAELAVDGVASKVARIMPEGAQRATEKIVGIVAEGAVEDCFPAVLNGVARRMAHNPKTINLAHLGFSWFLKLYTVFYGGRGSISIS